MFCGLFFIEAVHRYYESCRRVFNDCQPDRKEKAEESKKKAKKIYCVLRLQFFILNYPLLCPLKLVV